MNLHEKKKWIFKQSAAPTLATLAGAANGLRLLAARGLAGMNDLRLMARQNDLSYNGTKSELLSTIAKHFGYQMFIQESNFSN